MGSTHKDNPFLPPVAHAALLLTKRGGVGPVCLGLGVAVCSGIRRFGFLAKVITGARFVDGVQVTDEPKRKAA